MEHPIAILSRPEIHSRNVILSEDAEHQSASESKDLVVGTALFAPGILLAYPNYLHRPAQGDQQFAWDKG